MYVKVLINLYFILFISGNTNGKQSDILNFENHWKKENNMLRNKNILISIEDKLNNIEEIVNERSDSKKNVDEAIKPDLKGSKYSKPEVLHGKMARIKVNMAIKSSGINNLPMQRNNKKSVNYTYNSRNMDKKVKNMDQFFPEVGKIKLSRKKRNSESVDFSSNPNRYERTSKIKNEENVIFNNELQFKNLIDRVEKTMNKIKSFNKNNRTNNGSFDIPHNKLEKSHQNIVPSIKIRNKRSLNKSKDKKSSKLVNHKKKKHNFKNHSSENDEKLDSKTEEKISEKEKNRVTTSSTISLDNITITTNKVNGEIDDIFDNEIDLEKSPNGLILIVYNPGSSKLKFGQMVDGNLDPVMNDTYILESMGKSKMKDTKLNTTINNVLKKYIYETFVNNS
ncbi:uncharacterized protein [Lepeophtheirus salmonis]|uniref:uncharacterized protein n=1 Tax=Lepeophtheirus salmonis TaxID=72036 RepID=UPI001AE9F231|nr:probable serine/threonine-protein kinase tsuA [Lepeophtheirus salmonis]